MTILCTRNPLLSSGCLRWMGVALGALVLMLVALVTVTWLRGSRTKAELRAKYPPPVRMVDVGGYQMHIYCLRSGDGLPGSGSPTPRAQV